MHHLKRVKNLTIDAGWPLGKLTLQQNCAQELEDEIELLFVPAVLLLQFLDFIRLSRATVSNFTQNIIKY